MGERERQYSIGLNDLKLTSTIGVVDVYQMRYGGTKQSKSNLIV